MKHVLLSFAFVLTVCFLGCKKNQPDDLPPLYPCKITITIDGKPTEGVSVSLVPDDGSKWAAGGTTDANGVATMSVHGRFPGAAAGQYKVSIVYDKIEVIGESVKETPMVKPEYSNPSKTPLEYTMEPKKSEVTFDVPSP